MKEQVDHYATNILNHPHIQLPGVTICRAGIIAKEIKSYLYTRVQRN
jgi:hypothetical protein